MELSDIRLKELEKENYRLKQMYADLSLEQELLKGIIEKKVIKPAKRKSFCQYAIIDHGL
ncbi:MAG: hypothetical protein SWO11_18345 [Thermodesulfobacteriota bacterium]|nr:hypothetical protein [Thermodesulfobacteriota bacterium]